jgi:hypothetical protein
MLLLADVAIAPMIFSGGALVGGLLFIFVVALESLVLWRLKWGNFRRSFVDTLIANAVSTILGLGIYLVVFNVGYDCRSVPYSDGVHVVTSCGWSISPIIVFVLLWIASVIIEGGVLLLMRRHPPRQTWKVSIVANIVSYLLLSPFFAALFLI